MKIRFILLEILFFILVAFLVVFSFVNRNCAVWILLAYVLGTTSIFICTKINLQKKKIQDTENSKNRIIKLMNIINSYVVIWNEDASILLIKFLTVYITGGLYGYLDIGLRCLKCCLATCRLKKPIIAGISS